MGKPSYDDVIFSYKGYDIVSVSLRGDAMWFEFYDDFWRITTKVSGSEILLTEPPEVSAAMYDLWGALYYKDRADMVAWRLTHG